jgi:diguanylate cyclase (GGDEF)-like protein/PAS domain S-box-containing protein
MVVDEALRFLIVEDAPAHVERLRTELRRAFPRGLATRVETEEGFRQMLDEFAPDAVLSGLHLAGFDGLAALRLARQLAPGTPFLIISGSVDIEGAVRCMREGADDYLLRGRLAHLGTALREALARRRQAALPPALLVPFQDEDGLWDWNLRRNRIVFSPRWKSMIGYASDEMGDRPEEWLSLVHPADITRLSQALTTSVRASGTDFEVQYRIQHKDGGVRWMLSRGVVLRDSRGRPYRVVGAQTDVTARNEAEARLRHQSAHDPLTGLANRHLFLARLDQAILEARRQGKSSAAVMVLDLDRFRLVNASFGQAEGDRVLREFTRRVGLCLRRIDTLARLGADAFVILVEGIQHMGEALHLAGRIETALESPFRVAEHDVFVTASIGIAPAEPHYASSSALLADADATMHVAKARGGGQHEVFHPGIHEQIRLRLETESELRQGLASEQIRLYYQPTVSLATGELVGFEALARWEHPQRGLVTPADFIPLAEETGLIVALGQRLWREACRFARALDDMGAQSSLSVSVNLSAREFIQPDLIAHFAEGLGAAGIDGRRLRVEITESLILRDLDKVSRTVVRLKEMGISVDVDDFGTGYASLDYLRALPLDALKIDRSFVSRMATSAKDAAIVRSIVGLARRLGIGCVAEGVSAPRQVRELQAAGCRHAQGFLFAAPVHAEGARALVGRRWAVASDGPRPAGGDAALSSLLDHLERLLEPAGAVETEGKDADADG